MNLLNQLKSSAQALLLLTCAMVLLDSTTSLAQSITAEMARPKPSRAVIEIALQRPAPGNLIVELQYPPRLKVDKLSPKAAKIDPDRGVLKWLIRKAKPGKMKFQVDFSEPFDTNDVSGFVRYRSTVEGSLVELEVDWK